MTTLIIIKDVDVMPGILRIESRPDDRSLDRYVMSMTDDEGTIGLGMYATLEEARSHAIRLADAFEDVSDEDSGHVLVAIHEDGAVTHHIRRNVDGK